jgi:predicted ATPase
MFQITILGSMSVGKTTLIKLLQQDSRTKNFAFIPESATQIIDRFNSHPREMTIDQRCQFQQRVLDNQIANERSLRQNKSNFIGDRGVIDGLSYSLELPNYQNLKDQIQDYLIQNPYTHVIFLPIEFNFDSANRSSEDTAFQQMIDTNIKSVLKSLNINYTELKGQSIERKEQLIKLILG